jgi:hypothetical protein
MKTNYKTLIFTFGMIFSYQITYAQSAKTDSIFTNEGLILANVKDITIDVIKYSFPDEELNVSVHKNAVKKIVFKSGRTQFFTTDLGLNLIDNAYEYEKVKFTRFSDETKGLIKIDEIFATVTSSSSFSDAAITREKGLRKLKIQAAILGGNLVYVTEDSGQNNSYWSGYHAGNIRETVAIGSVFTNKTLDINEFKAFIGDKNEFNVYSSIYIGNNNIRIQENIYFPRKLIIEDIYAENKFIYLKIASNKKMRNQTQMMRVISFRKGNITLQYKVDDRIYNLFLDSE